MKILLNILAVILLFTSSVFAEKEVVKIGVLLPLSGDLAGVGEDIQKGFLLAQKEAKPNNFKYELVFEDDAQLASKATMALNKLLHVDKVDVVFCLWSNVANTVAPLTEKAKIPLFSIMWDDSLPKRSKYVFTHETTATEFALATEKIIKHQGWKSAAVFEAKTNGWSTATDFLRERLKQSGIPIVAYERVNPGMRDFRAVIQETLKKKPDGIVIYHQIPDSEILLKQIREQDPNIPITGYLNEVKTMKDMEGIVFPALAISTTDFAARFQKEYGKPLLMRGAHAFDIYNIIVKVYEESGKTTKLSPDEFAAGVKKLKNYPGAVGTLNADQYGIINSPVVFRQVKNGKLQDYKF